MKLLTVSMETLAQEGGSPASLLRLRQEERPFSLIR